MLLLLVLNYEGGRKMYKVQVNKDRCRNHIQYDWWKYLVGGLVTVFLWIMITEFNKPRMPPDKKIELFLVGDYILDDSIDSISDDILEDFPHLLDVHVQNIPLGVDMETDYLGRQKLMVMLGSQTGDLYVFDRDEFKQIAEQGVFVPLDDFITENKDLIGDRDLEMHRATIFEEDAEVTVEHYFGIPMGDIELFDNTGFDVSDKLIGIMSYSKNQTTAFDVLKWILNDGSIN